MCSTLNILYYNIWQELFTPLDDSDFIDELLELDDGLNKITLSESEVEEIVKDLLLQFGFSLDGVPPHCMRYGGLTIIEAICDIAKTSRYEEFIPEVMKTTWVLQS